jgi:hypothetical protein
VFTRGGKVGGKAQMPMKRSFHRERAAGGLEKGLANLWTKRRITKKSTLVAGKKSNGQRKIPQSEKRLIE